MNKKDTIFLLGGITGGPIIPLLSYTHFLPDYQYHIVGVNGGFEKELASRLGLPFHTLLTTKQLAQNTREIYIQDRIANFFRSFGIIAKILLNIVSAIYMCLKHQPKAIVTAGSFLGVTFAYTIKLLRMLKLTKTKLILHQQDVVASKSNLIAANTADFISVVFQETIDQNPTFHTGTKTLNLIDPSRFSLDSLEKVKAKLEETDPELVQFLTQKRKKPLLYVFGGGGGSLFINDFVKQNFSFFSQKYDILHMIGYKESAILPSDNHYLSRRRFSYDEQAWVLANADIILARPGMGTITELEYLNKPAVLIPLAFTHQENNSEIIKSKNFTILHGGSTNSYKYEPVHDTWLKLINNISTPRHLTNKTNTEYAVAMKEYFKKIQSIL